MSHLLLTFPNSREKLDVGFGHIILRFLLHICLPNLLEEVHARDFFQLLVGLIWLYGAWIIVLFLLLSWVFFYLWKISLHWRMFNCLTLSWHCTCYVLELLTFCFVELHKVNIRIRLDLHLANRGSFLWANSCISNYLDFVNT